jgi:hypothetical protein
MTSTSRRQFLATLPLAGAGFAATSAQETTPSAAAGSVTFGFITDVHHGTHGKDQVARLTPFIDAAIARKPDFIIQCGDFYTNCHSRKYDPGKPPFTFITLDAGKCELRIEESLSTYEGQAKMKSEHVWLTPPLLRGRTLPFG